MRGCEVLRGLWGRVHEVQSLSAISYRGDSEVNFEVVIDHASHHGVSDRGVRRPVNVNGPFDFSRHFRRTVWMGFFVSRFPSGDGCNCRGAHLENMTDFGVCVILRQHSPTSFRTLFSSHGRLKIR